MKSKKFLIIFFVLLLTVFIGGMYFSQANKLTKRTPITPTINPEDKKELVKKQQRPAPFTERQQKQIGNQTSASTKDKQFDIAGGDFYFSPGKITVNQGDSVTIIFINKSGLHNFIIDELKVKTPPMQQEGQFVVAKFTADKKGTYIFYSEYPQDRAMEMKGTLIVQ